jgi:hypothetical protein
MPNHNTNQLKLESGEDILNVISPYLTKAKYGYDFDFSENHSNG